MLGGVASVAGTRQTFGAVAAAALLIAVWAARTPAARPERPQPLSMLFRAFGDRRMLLSMWLVVLPALLFGTLAVLGPLRLNALGWGSVAIGAVWLVSGAIESGNNIVIGRLSDRYGPLLPVRIGLLATVVACALLPWPQTAWVFALVLVFAEISFGTFYTPGMTLLTHAAEDRSLDYGYAFAIINLAWAPGQSLGSAVGGAVAQATSDAVPYYTLCGIALLTLAGLWRSRSSS